MLRIKAPPNAAGGPLKEPFTRVDAPSMDRLLEQFFVLALILSGIAGLAVLHCAACAVKNHHQVHDLKAKVNRLRTMQLKRVRDREMNGDSAKAY